MDVFESRGLEISLSSLNGWVNCIFALKTQMKEVVDVSRSFKALKLISMNRLSRREYQLILHVFLPVTPVCGHKTFIYFCPCLLGHVINFRFANGGSGWLIYVYSSPKNNILGTRTQNRWSAARFPVFGPSKITLPVHMTKCLHI